MSGKSDLFAGFEAFAAPQAQEGTLTVVYGLSVDTIQVVGEAKAANPEGLTPAALAAKLASKFNMPPTGLRVFIDGQEVEFGAPIPTGAKTLEFRQPSGEKGSTVTLPLADTDAVIISVARRDTINYLQIREEPKGMVSLGLLDVLHLGEMAVLEKGPCFATVGYRHPEVKATRTALRLESTIRRHAGGEIPGAASSVSVIMINDLVKGERPIAVRLNGKVLTDGTCRELVAGDRLEVILPGETRQEDFEEWAEDQRIFAVGGHWAANIERDEKVAARAVELAQMNWAQLRIAGAKAGVKLSGLGRNSDAIRADILMAEFPELPSKEEFVQQWLKENAPEVLEA